MIRNKNFIGNDWKIDCLDRQSYPRPRKQARSASPPAHEKKSRNAKKSVAIRFGLCETVFVAAGDCLHAQASERQAGDRGARSGGQKRWTAKRQAGLRLSPAPSGKYLMVLDRAPARKVQRDCLDRQGQTVHASFCNGMLFANRSRLEGEGVGPTRV